MELGALWLAGTLRGFQYALSEQFLLAKEFRAGSRKFVRYS